MTVFPPRCSLPNPPHDLRLLEAFEPFPLKINSGKPSTPKKRTLKLNTSLSEVLKGDPCHLSWPSSQDGSNCLLWREEKV